MKTRKPWGYEEVLVENTDYALKKISVDAGQRLSLQSHNEKHETWLVMCGEGRAMIGNMELELKPKMQVDILPGIRHRLEAESILVVLEVSNGIHDGDVVRYEDDYGRAKG